MVTRPKKLFIVLALFVAATAVMLTPALISAQAPVKNVRDSFAQPEQTIEYHFMLNVPDLREKEMEKIVQSKVIDPLKSIADIGRLGKPRAGIYIDSRDYVLDKHFLIVRVRQGQITIKSRGAAPESLIDLADCGAKKYEMDYFAKPEYSISSDIKFKPEEFATTPPGFTVPGLWAFMEKKCPALFEQVRPYAKNAAIEIPGVATMYGADIDIKSPSAPKLKEGSLAVWFFPATDKSLVEFAFTGYNRDRESLDKLYTESMETVRKAGLLKAEQISKTRQYFRAYFGSLPPNE
jgi:hypothetical protein